MVQKVLSGNSGAGLQLTPGDHIVAIEGHTLTGADCSM